MNRTIALFVALVMLLAHVLSIHTDARGLVAVAWDQAHVPFRLGRNLIYEGQLAWNPGMEAFESYPSVLWVLLCALFERVSALMHGSVNVFAQTTGVLCALATTVVVSRVQPQRAAGLMAALILATSGAFAAAAVSGLETALFVWLLAWAFLAFERGRGWWMGFLLALAMLTRPETLLFVAGFAVLRAFSRPSTHPRPVDWLPFCVPLTTFAIGAVARGLTSGHAWPPSFDPWLNADAAQLSAGFLTLKAFVLITIVPLLLVWPLLYLVRGRLSTVGAHAAFFAVLWMIAAAWRGGGVLPFFEAFVPALPFLAIAAQEGLMVAFDAPSKFVRRTALACLALALGGSVLASKTPGDIGPLKGSAYYALSATPAPQVRLDYDEPLGRLALHEEIAHTTAVMGGEDWEMWMDDLLAAGVLAPGVRTLAYSYLGPVLTWPIYKNGTIGRAKQDLERCCASLNSKLAPLGGKAWVSVNKALVTQASSAIPVVPLYISLLYKIMKAGGTHEECIEQMDRLFRDRLSNAEPATDSEGRIRLDDWEMTDAVQNVISERWDTVDTSNFAELADFAGYQESFLRLFGFGLPGVDYQAEVEPEVSIPSLA
jgi:enoyl-[acyl-carrier protein] reductase/trans-2-enoyl-CoA reductase (NAD+)